MMPRYGMDTAGQHHGYGRDMDFTRKWWSIGYDMISCIVYFEVSGYHSLEVFLVLRCCEMIKYDSSVCLLCLLFLCLMVIFCMLTLWCLNSARACRRYSRDMDFTLKIVLLDAMWCGCMPILNYLGFTDAITIVLV